MLKKGADVIRDWHKTLLHDLVPSLIKKWELRLNVRGAGHFLQRMKPSEEAAITRQGTSASIRNS
jgi:hypothetical protein